MATKFFCGKSSSLTILGGEESSFLRTIWDLYRLWRHAKEGGCCGEALTPSESLQLLGRSGLQGYNNQICISILVYWEPFQAQLQPEFGKRADNLKAVFSQLHYCIHFSNGMNSVFISVRGITDLYPENVRLGKQKRCWWLYERLEIKVVFIPFSQELG